MYKCYISDNNSGNYIWCTGSDNYTPALQNINDREGSNNLLTRVHL